MIRCSVRAAAVLMIAACSATTVVADAMLDKLVAGGQWKEAIEYADNSIPAPSRNADVWVKLGAANENSGLTEKALACYLVAWRLEAGSYGALIGAAKIYNKLQQPDQALTMAKKALDVNFTADASWEYASACIKLGRAADAKKALEKVIETDPNNAVANRELGSIYFTDKEYPKAITLLRKSYDNGKDPNTAMRIATCYREVGKLDSALAFMEIAVAGGLKSPEVVLDLARIYFGRSQFADAAKRYDAALNKTQWKPDDYFKMASAKEQLKDMKGALDAYRLAVNAYGATNSAEAITANLKVGQAAYEAKQYPIALSHLQFVQNADKAEKQVPNINFMLADVYAGMGNAQAAMASLEKAIAKDQKNYEAYARLAEMYEKAGMADKARQTYEKMLALSPNDPKVFLVLGLYNLKMKKYQESLDLLLKSDELAPSAEAEEGIAIASIQLNQWNRAREAAKSAITKNPELVESRIILSKVYLRAEEWADAKKMLDVLVKKEPRNLEYLQQLAKCNEALKDTKGLSEVDQLLVNLDPKNALSRMRLAQYQLGEKKLDQAYELLKAVSMLEPQNADALLLLFQIARDTNKKPEAVIWVKKYLAINAKDAERQRDLGDLEYDAQNWDGALTAYRIALKLDPGLKGFYKRYADVVLKKGEQGEVILALTTLIQRGQADMSVYTTLGSIYEKQSQFNKAIEVYRQALAIEPSNSDLLASYAACQAKVGDVNGAIITYEQVIMMNSKARDEHRALGELYEKQNKIEQAVKSYMMYLDRGATDQAIASKVGRFAIDKGKYDVAYKYLGLIKGEPANETNFLMVFGEAAFYSEKYDEAVSAYVRLLERNPQGPQRKQIVTVLSQAYEKQNKNVDAARMYAELNKIAGGKNSEAAYKSAFLQETANPAAAVTIYEANCKAFPTDARNYLRLGLIYSKDKAKLPSSINMLKKAASLADTVPQVWLELAAVYGKLGNTDDELNAYKQFAKSDAQNVQANKRIGLILMNKNQVTNAMVYLETANALQPDDPEIMAALADGYVKTNRQKEAVDLLMKVRDKQPNNTDVRYRLFQMLKTQGRLPEAQKEIEAVLAQKRENEYLKEYAGLLVQMGKTKDAIEKVEDVLATEPENISALMLKAMIYRIDKKITEAIEVYKEISYIDPNNAEALYQRAETHMLEQKIQWASTFYNRALRADPNHAMSELGLAKIAKLAKNKEQYMQHLDKAYKLDPNNKEIANEYMSAKK